MEPSPWYCHLLPPRDQAPTRDSSLHPPSHPTGWSRAELCPHSREQTGSVTTGVGPTAETA